MTEQITDKAPGELTKDERTFLNVLKEQVKFKWLKLKAAREIWRVYVGDFN